MTDSIDDPFRCFRCICDPDILFDPPNPTPVAVEGCPAHRTRRNIQQCISYLDEALSEDPTPQELTAAFERWRDLQREETDAGASRSADSCGAALTARCFNGPAGCRVHRVYPELQHKRHYGVTGQAHSRITGWRDLPPNGWGYLSVRLYDDATPLPIIGSVYPAALRKGLVYCGPEAPLPLPDTATRRSSGA